MRNLILALATLVGRSLHAQQIAGIYYMAGTMRADSTYLAGTVAIVSETSGLHMVGFWTVQGPGSKVNQVTPKLVNEPMMKTKTGDFAVQLGPFAMSGSFDPAIDTVLVLSSQDADSTKATHLGLARQRDNARAALAPDGTYEVSGALGPDHVAGQVTIVRARMTYDASLPADRTPAVAWVNVIGGPSDPYVFLATGYIHADGKFVLSEDGGKKRSIAGTARGGQVDAELWVPIDKGHSLVARVRGAKE